MLVLNDENGVYKKILKYYKQDQVEKKTTAKIGNNLINSKPKIFEEDGQLGLYDDTEMQDFFKSMCEDKDQK